jgi:hypothetical protein
MRTCHRHYPGRFHGACSLVSLHRQRPSLCNSQVGSCNCFFEACSAFTHVMACTLAESLNDPLHRKLRQLRCLCCRFDCYRVERTSSRAGVTPAEVQRLSTAHYYANYLECFRFERDLLHSTWSDCHRKRLQIIARRRPLTWSALGQLSQVKTEFGYGAGAKIMRFRNTNRKAIGLDHTTPATQLSPICYRDFTNR